jgi:protein-tyrosine phosphatase
LDFLGATWENYKQIATKHGIEIVRLPMQEGSAPESLEQVKNVIDRVDVVIESGKNVLAHCRGGKYHCILSIT